MFINKLNQLYKPERILYYIEASEQDIAAFYGGAVKDEIGRYADSYGTYDYPGIFYVKSLSAPVIGIEFRASDSGVSYPDGLSSVILDEAFFYSVEIDGEAGLGIKSIRDIFAGIFKDDDAHRQYSDLTVSSDPEVISVFASGGRIRINCECRLEDDRAKYVINDDAQALDKEKVYRLAFFDPITGHYNWNHLVPYLEMPMDGGIRDYAFAHFDIKAFRVINEVYGHIAANKVLSNVVKALNEADFVYTSARCHNDNFAMMIKDMPEEETVRRLTQFFDELSHLDEDRNYRIYYRCGVVPMRRSVLSGNRVADAAKMAQAMGTNNDRTDIIIFTDEMHDNILWGNCIKAYADTAIENDEFEVYLQPKFGAADERLKGAEALIRWNYKKKTFLQPSRFVPFFERDGTIGKIDDIVLKKVCAAFTKWKTEGRVLCPISVNLSRSQLYNNDLTEHLTGIVDSFGVDHGLIDFELTESATYDNKEHMIYVLNDLRNRGFRISMDDFGTGYSSLSLLAEMPLDTLKIDKSFVDNVGTENESDKDIVILRHIISLAGELGFSCLAEGVERKCQAGKLRSLGCDTIQGYYYGRPVPVEEYERLFLPV